MDAKLKEFLRRCDLAIQAAKDALHLLLGKQSSSSLVAAAEQAINNLQRLKETAEQGRLPRPSHGAGLGLSRALGEWADGTPLFAAACALEEYYSDQM